MTFATLIMAADIGQISQLLNATLDPAQHRKAETALKQEATKPQYSLTLLNIVNSDTLPVSTRLSAALAFKNFLRSNYVDEDGNYKLPQDEVQVIKERLIGLMISCPSSVQTQLGEAISIIADSDFWRRWDTLTQQLVSRFSTTDPKTNAGVLEVAHSIFARWRPLFRTDELYMEINHVIETFGRPFVQLLVTTDAKITENADKKDALQGWFEVLDLQIKILYDMSCHDIPPIFEENLGSISELLHKYLAYANPLLETDDDAEASILDTVKADICELLELYTVKFDEDFNKYCQPFITSAWNLLSTTGTETKHDIVVSKALHFLTAIASIKTHAVMFNNEDVLTQIVEKVILPNVALRESDIEMFEDEPIEFIRRDLEGSDSDSRRRSATDFLQKLLLQDEFEAIVTGVVYKYINHYLTQGKTDWKAKDTAVYLFIAIAAKGAVTAAQGVKTINSKVNVVEFFEQHIASDLLADQGVEPIAKVDAIKYLYTFRSQLSKEQWKQAFGPLIQNLNSDNYVVYTYAAIAVERVLFLVDDAGNPMFPRADIEPFSKDLLEHLFKLIERESSPAKLQENEFLMRCVMRILIVIKDGATAVLENVLGHLIAITNIMKQNPSNPRFYYYHFEALGAVVRYCSATSANLFNQQLWEPFHQVLIEDISEFMPYVFQILAQLLESSPSDAISENYKALLGPLLNPSLWETRGNVPACTRLLSAVIPRASKSIVAENQVEAILGIFQKLLSSKKSELYAFDILDSIIKSFEPAVVDKYFPTILQLLFTKLQGQPAESLKLRFARFYHLVSARIEAGYGADYFIRQSEQVDEKVFTQVYPPFVLAETEKLARPVDRKAAVISLTKTVCDSQAFAQKFAKGWANTCRILLSLLVNPPTVGAGQGDEIIAEADVDDIGFGMSFTALNSCKPLARDDFPEVPNVATWTKEYIQAANQRHGGAIEGFISARLPPDQQQALAAYLR
ncbi:Importin alpha re-exporter [Paramyrothecium foliicola]|nr:Importin alpha re-exporter [Paramyrothecium foliicola]